MSMNQPFLPFESMLENNYNPNSIVFDLDKFKDKNYLTHNFHPYPAKFVPQIPQKIIQALSKREETILDPFCGSGTSLVEANLIGRFAIGIDLNPLACLIARVKTTTLSNIQIPRIREVITKISQILHEITIGNYLCLEDQLIPKFLNRDHWFQHNVLKELTAIRTLIFELPDGPECDFLKVAFSAIIVKVSNQESDTRWAAKDKQIHDGFALKEFILKTNDMLARIKQYKLMVQAKSQVYQQCITEALSIDSEFIDLIVTSPPYLNSYDYYLYHKLRFYWLGMDHYQVQDKELGSRNRHCDKGEGIETYSTGIVLALKEMFRLLKARRYLCIVIGDSILKGTFIKMNEIYCDLAESVGFKFVHIFSYDQRKYTLSFTRNLKDVFKQSHIIFFQKPC